MMRWMFKSKIHRATVTEAELHYEGSITIDEALMEAADLKSGERVQVVNVDNGERFETYVIPGRRNSGVICLNGPAARKAVVGDTIIIISYALMTEEEMLQYRPVVVHVDKHNRIVKKPADLEIRTA